MKHFISIEDVDDPIGLAKQSIMVKQNPLAQDQLGKNKVLGLIFFNSSLRTRMSITRAAYNLGMQVITLNVSSDSWLLEMQDGVVMDGGTAEHIREAVPVMASYCDILAVRSFPSLTDKTQDYQELIIQAFVKGAGKPVINLESSTLHPLQSLTDVMTIEELKKTERPKVVMTWAPHTKALPQAVPNSFAQWINAMDYEWVITHPKGMELDEQFTQRAHIEYDQQVALKGADFVYVKNWSSFKDYGQVHEDRSWMMTLEKLQHTNQAKLMHCLPVRRNLVISDDALDSPHSVVIRQAENRLYTAQAVLMELLKGVQEV